MALLPGRKVVLAGREFTVPSLSFYDVRRFAEVGTFKKMAESGEGGNFTAPQVDAMFDLFHAAIARNYPELTREDLLKIVDLANFGDLMAAVRGISKLDQPSGEGTGTA